MARYKFVDMSPRLLPVVLEDQLVPVSFAHAVHHLADALDLSGFDAHYRNGANGATAYAPSMLLKAVLLAYSKDIVSANDRASLSGQRIVRSSLTTNSKDREGTRGPIRKSNSTDNESAKMATHRNVGSAATRRERLQQLGAHRLSNVEARSRVRRQSFTR